MLNTRGSKTRFGRAKLTASRAQVTLGLRRLVAVVNRRAVLMNAVSVAEVGAAIRVFGLGAERLDVFTCE